MAAFDLLSNDVPAGSLRCRVDLYGPSLGEDGEPVRDDANAIVTDQVLLAQKVWARVLAQKGQARYATDQYVDRMSHVITIRWRAGIAAGMNVHYGKRKFEVKYPLDPEERHRWLHLLCLEDGL